MKIEYCLQHRSNKNWSDIWQTCRFGGKAVADSPDMTIQTWLDLYPTCNLFRVVKRDYDLKGKQTYVKPIEIVKINRGDDCCKLTPVELYQIVK